MKNETKQYTEEEISKMTMKEWRAAGMPALSFEFKYKMTEQEDFTTALADYFRHHTLVYP